MPLFVIFLMLFLPVFVLVMIAATLVTFILPESFASEARIKVSLITAPADAAKSTPASVVMATEIETLLSETLLVKVVEALNLNTEWGRKYLNGEKLKTTESVAIMRGRLEIKPVPNTTIISIRVFSEDRAEAAQIANSLAETYRQAAPVVSPTVSAQLIDRAQPGLRPVRPNKPLNIILGMILGLLLGAGAGGIAAALIAQHRAQRQHAVAPVGLKPIH